MKLVHSFTTLLVAATTLWCTTYYVDYDAGNDANAGTSQSTAWKHVPGDPSATATPRNFLLKAGDVVLFKGGVIYRGRFDVTVSGSAQNPIVYKGDGWGSDRAILDGSEPVTTTWTKCQSQADASGNPNWQHIWVGYLPTVQGAHFLNLHQNNEFLYVAQYPEPRDGFYNDQIADFAKPDEITRTSLRFTGLNSLGGSSLVGCYVWTYQGNNSVLAHKIKGFSAAENMITFDDIGDDPYTGQQARFALSNYVSFLTSPGKYVVEEKPSVNNKYKMYLWPLTGDPTTQNLSMSVRGYGILVQNQSNITIEGFTIQRFCGDGTWGGNSVMVLRSSNVAIRNLIMTHNRHIYTGGYGMFVDNSNNVVVEKNVITENGACRGIYSNQTTKMVFRKNIIRKVGGTAVMFFTCINSQVIDNVVVDNWGSHGNGLTFYSDNQNILIARNVVVNSNLLITLSNSKNLMIYNNVFNGCNRENYLMAVWDNAMAGTNCIFNNTFVGSVGNSCIYPGASDADKKSFILKNNILDGGHDIDTRSHNLYVGVNGYMKTSKSWLKEGEIIGWNGTECYPIDSSKTFINPDSGKDLRLKSGSLAIDAGIDAYSYMKTLAQTNSDVSTILSVFPDFDWTLDIQGQKRVLGKTWDLGAFEYGGVTTKKQVGSNAVTPELKIIRTEQSFLVQANNLGKENAVVRLYSLRGRIVGQWNVSSAHSLVNINEGHSAQANLGKGCYIIMLQSPMKEVRAKVMMH